MAFPDKPVESGPDRPASCDRAGPPVRLHGRPGDDAARDGASARPAVIDYARETADRPAQSQHGPVRRVVRPEGTPLGAPERESW